MNRRLGKLPPRLDPRTLKLAKYLAPGLPKPPAALDWTQGQQAGWGMMLNDELGDCTIAGAAHAIQLWSRQVMTEATVGDADVLAAYEQWTGYDPANPATDQGGVELDVLNDWRNKGLAGHKLLGYAAIDAANLDEVRQAINLFGGVYIGLDLPRTAQRQTVWDVDLSQGRDADEGTWGGHCVFVPAYDAAGFTCITWGAAKKMTTAFFTTYCDEAYALLGQDWLNMGGVAPSSFDAAQLMADLAELA